MFARRNYDEILADAISRLSTNTEFTGVANRGSPSRAILEVVCGKLADMYADIYGGITDSVYLSTSVGAALDKMAELFDISRRMGESDDSLRYRIVHSHKSVNKCNREAIRLQLLNLDNVRDVVFKDYIMGMGSYGVYLVPESDTISMATLSSAQSFVNLYEAVGIRGIVLVPSEIPVDLEIKIYLDETAIRNELINASQAIVNSLASYISGLTLGEVLIFNRLIDVTFDASSAISDAEIKRIWINGKETLHRNYKPEFDEILRPRNITVI